MPLGFGIVAVDLILTVSQKKTISHTADAPDRPSAGIILGICGPMVKVLVIIVLVIALSVAGVLIWGAFLPSTVSATRSAVLRASVETVFARVTDPAGQTTWRTDVSAVTMEPGGTAWTETTRGGIVIGFEEVTREAPARYAIRFASPQGFDGAWEGVFAAEGENTR
ncbi:MAG: SRPBCC family protein, partial [Hyphomicrobiales bacterium]